MATAIGMAQSHLSRTLKSGKNFGPENCLRLALHTGVPAPQVLRAAGKTALADLIEQLYGPAQANLLPAEQAELVRLYESLEPQVQAAMLHLIRLQADPAYRHGLPPSVLSRRTTAR